MSTRSIELAQTTWDCPTCGRTAVLGVKKCRKCGRVQPVYGIIDEPEQKPAKVEQEPAATETSDEEQFFKSCLKMKDGRTYEDMKK